MIRSVDLEKPTVEPCPDNLVVAGVMLKIVHGVFKAKHLQRFSSPSMCNCTNVEGLTSA